MATNKLTSLIETLLFIDKLSDVIPEKLWINNFKNKGNAASFNGIAANEFIIADFMRNLQKNEHFTYANVGTIKNQNVSGKPFKSFSMNVGLQFGQVEPAESKDQKNTANKSNAADNAKNLNDTGQIESKSSPDSEKMENMKNPAQKNEMKDSKPDNNSASDQKIEKKEEKKQASPSEKVGADDGSNVIVF